MMHRQCRRVDTKLNLKCRETLASVTITRKGVTAAVETCAFRVSSSESDAAVSTGAVIVTSPMGSRYVTRHWKRSNARGSC